MPRKPIAVIAADTHLAPRIWARRPDINGDAYFGFSQAVDVCVKYQLPLILPGDVFDKMRPDPYTIWFTKTQLERLSSVGLPMWFIQGQHELDRQMPWLLSISQNVHSFHWVHKKNFRINGIEFFGLDWTPADIVQDELACIPHGTDVLIAHQVWGGFMGNYNKHECQFSDVPHVALIVTGDYHRLVFMPTTNNNNAPCRVLSPGPLCMQSIDEDPNKFVHLLYDDLTIDHVPIKTRNVYRIALRTVEDLNDVLVSTDFGEALQAQADVPPDIAKNLIHITYKDDIPEAYGRIVSAVGNRAHLFIVANKSKAMDMTIAPEYRDLLTTDVETSLALVVNKESRTYSDILTLLRSQDTANTLKELRDNFVNNLKAKTNEESGKTVKRQVLCAVG